MVSGETQSVRTETGMGQGGLITAPETQPPPRLYAASGFPSATGPGLGLGRRKAALTRESGDRPCKETRTAVGCDGKEHKMNMTTTTITRASDKTKALLSVLGMAMLGMVILFAAGHAQSATLHDAAHDVRHATGFPCH
jgi:cobalt transporter subunit CbtB